MEVDEFLDILHLGTHRQLEATENLRYHLGSNEVVVVESPTSSGFPTLRLGLANVVEQGSPTEPLAVSCWLMAISLHNVFQDFEGVIEVVLMRTVVTFLDDIEGGEFGQDDVQQT